MKFAFIGDVVGRHGRRVLTAAVEHIRNAHAPDLIIANAENSAGGFGLTRKSIREMEAAGVAFFTTGNHVWDKPEAIPLLDETTNIVRPANFPAPAPGRGYASVPGFDQRVVVVNLQGRVFMPPLDCPFRAVDAILAEIDAPDRIVIVDMHAEATSEKIAMGWVLDGRVAAVLGTHTHVPTRDARILPGGTAFVTDVGMTGSYESILGVEREAVIRRFYNMRPTRFVVARGDLRCDYVVADVNDDNGRATRFLHEQFILEEQ